MNILSATKKASSSAKTYLGLFGVEGLLKRALLGMGGTRSEFKASIPNSTKKVIIRLGTTDVAAFEHVFVKNEYGFSLAHPPSVIVDAGANVGMSAAYFTLRYPRANVFAVEPERSNFEILRKNAELFPRIKPVNVALWNREGFVRVAENGSGHWGMRATEAKSSAGETVRATTVPELMRTLEIDRIDLLKIDVEGAECEILENSSTWIGRVGVICAELHDRFRPGCLNTYTAATADFPVKWRRGELHCAARLGLIIGQ